MCPRQRERWMGEGSSVVAAARGATSVGGVDRRVGGCVMVMGVLLRMERAATAARSAGGCAARIGT